MRRRHKLVIDITFEKPCDEDAAIRRVEGRWYTAAEIVRVKRLGKVVAAMKENLE